MSSEPGSPSSWLLQSPGQEMRWILTETLASGGASPARAPLGTPALGKGELAEFPGGCLAPLSISYWA